MSPNVPVLFVPPGSWWGRAGSNLSRGVRTADSALSPARFGLGKMPEPSSTLRSARARSQPEWSPGAPTLSSSPATLHFHSHGTT